VKILTDKKLVNLALPVVQSDMQLFVIDERVPVFDIFDRVNPDVLIIQSSGITSAITKNILERPHLKVVIINNNDEKLKKLENEIGNGLFVITNYPFCNIIGCKNAIEINELKSDVVCLEGADIKNINDIEFPISVNFKIFSNKKLIHHNNFCGALNENLRLNALKSSKHCIVNLEDMLDAIMLDCIPITDNSFLSPISVSKEEIKNQFTNFHIISKILQMLGYKKEAESVMGNLEQYL
jgi:hypothetical protein